MYDEHPSIQNINASMCNNMNVVCFHTVKESDVEKELRSVNSKKAQGYDNMPPKLFKVGAEAISPSLTQVIYI